MSLNNYTMKLVALNGQRGKFFLRDLDSRRVGVFVERSPNPQAGIGGRVADPVDHKLPAH